ncbi:MAG: hypothetical protein ABR521_11910 [Gaiellaceae bacterium]
MSKTSCARSAPSGPTPSRDPPPLLRLGEAGGQPQPDGPLWFPRVFQGEGRHDNPDLFGCLYLSTEEVSGVVEQLAPFRGQRLTPPLLVRRGLPLAPAAIELDDSVELVDLDEPEVLAANRTRRGCAGGRPMRRCGRT